MGPHFKLVLCDKGAVILATFKSFENHQIPSCQTNTTSKLYQGINKYRNKLTTHYFNSFCQPFHMIVFNKIFDQYLICSCEKNFQPANKKVIEIEK